MQAKFGVLYGNGDGTLQPVESHSISRVYTGLNIADTDKDGKRDLIFVQSGGLAVVPNIGGRQFDQEQSYVAGSSLFKINVADLNADGFPDVVASTGLPSVVAILYGGSSANSLLTAQLGVNFSPEPSGYGQSYTVTFNAQPRNPGDTIPTGSASMSLNGALFATQALVQGTTVFTVSGNRFPGTQNITVAYNGDDFYRSGSVLTPHVVNPQIFATHTVLNATPNPLNTSQTLRLLATVTTAGTHLQGSVTFVDGNRVLRSKIIDANGVAVFDTATLSAGTHNIMAMYQGLAVFNDLVRETYTPSSDAASVVVNAYPTETTIRSSATSATLGTVLTFTATVTAQVPPFGSVVFDDGPSALGAATLRADGTAVLSTIWRSGRGRHDITAHYVANSIFASSDSPSVMVSIQSVSAGASPTVTTLAETRSEGQTMLVGHVIPVNNSGGSGDGPIGGQITFLNKGEVLGAAHVDANGFARMESLNLNTNEFVLSASFSGDQTHAASASPELHVALPAADSFSIAATKVSDSGISDGDLPIEVTVAGASGFHDMVTLGCGDELPEGYSCTFTPSSLDGGGTSQLLIVNDGALANRNRNLGSSVLALACFIFGLAGVRRHRVSGVILSGLILMCLAGCGTPAQKSQEQTVVLTLSAKSTAAGSVVLRSTQIAVRIH